MDKLNVCLINDSFPPAIDGVANAVVNYGRIINSGLGKASVVTPFYPDADDSSFGFPVIRYPSIDMTKLVGYRAGIPFSADIMRQVESSGFDLIHSHCPITSTLFARTLRERLDVPIVLTYHTKFDIDIANAVKSRLLQAEAAKLLVENISSCDEVWTVSRGAGDNLRKLGYTGKYTVVPNGVDLPLGRVDDAAVEAACAGYDLPEGVPLFLFVGRMMWYKGIRIILDALAGLMSDDVDFRMVFIGGGGDREKIVSCAESLGLNDRVFFIDPIRDRDVIRAWYCRADMFLFPSTFDTNGLVVREAAACGLASVLVDGSCAAEDSTDGEDGFLIQEDAESMRQVLKKLCSSPELMKEAGSKAAENLYISWEDAVKHAYELYGAVVDDYRRGLYPEHESPEDGMFRWASETLESVSRRKEFLRYVQEGFLREQQRYHEESEADAERVKRLLSERREQLQSIIEDGESKVLSEFESTKDTLMEKLDSISRFIDRYK